MFGEGLPTPPKRLTAGLLFTDARKAIESIQQDRRPSVGRFDGVGRPAPNWVSSVVHLCSVLIADDFLAGGRHRRMGHANYIR